MPTLKKLLSRFNTKERKSLERLIESIASLNWKSLDIKKLKGHEHIFRARKGTLRIIFSRENGEIFILSIERRSESTYKF